MKRKILIVDDDTDFREAISVLLEAKGYEVITASDGGEGYEKAKTRSPDLVLLDVMMTGRTEGIDVARRMRADKTTADIPVILTTGIRRDLNLGFGLEPDEELLPVRKVLEKPIKPEVLLREIGAIMAEK